MMNWNLISKLWNQLAEPVKSRWEKLTDDDHAEIDGSQEALTAKLQARYGFHRMDAEKKVADWAAGLTRQLEEMSRPDGEKISRPDGEKISRPDRPARSDSRSSSRSGEDREPSIEPSIDPRFKIADEERPESPTSKLTPSLDRRSESRDRPASPSSSDDTIP